MNPRQRKNFVRIEPKWISIGQRREVKHDEIRARHSAHLCWNAKATEPLHPIDLLWNPNARTASLILRDQQSPSPQRALRFLMARSEGTTGRPCPSSESF